ncbi:hypothetical protein HAX54_028472 [Datura stramonium]|uniref:Cytochrome P450 n=1 Tax=Datura stramonium TaxID=4076 RepID=A0ABS8RKR0_DATST|nr:hypothetical protein [Datura stramonium]
MQSMPITTITSLCGVSPCLSELEKLRKKILNSNVSPATRLTCQHLRIDPQGIRRRMGKLSDKLLQQIEGLINERLEQRRKSPNGGKAIEEADVARLPYLQCIVKELPGCTMDPLIRKVDEDVEACGYFVPKDSQVLVHVWALSAMLGSLLNSFDWKTEGDIAPEDLDVEEKFGITLARSRPLRAIPIPL